MNGKVVVSTGFGYAGYVGPSHDIFSAYVSKYTGALRGCYEAATGHKAGRQQEVLYCCLGHQPAIVGRLRENGKKIRWRTCAKKNVHVPYFQNRQKTPGNATKTPEKPVSYVCDVKRARTFPYRSRPTMHPASWPGRCRHLCAMVQVCYTHNLPCCTRLGL